MRPLPLALPFLFRPRVASVLWLHVRGLGLLALLIAFGAGSALGQQHDDEAFTLVLRGVSPEQALEKLVAVTQIDLIYDNDLMRDVPVYCTARDTPAESILQCIVEAAGLDYYRLSSGTYVLIESAEHEPRLGYLAGIVVDKDTGEPLPYANVFLADASLGTATNEAGMFSFAALLPGPNTLVATYVGYEPAIESIWIPPDGRVRRQIALQSRHIVTEPVVVNGLQQRLPARQLGAGKVDPKQVVTGGLGGTADVVQSAQSLVGVALRWPLADLHIQGGETGEHQMLLDGAPVFNPVSLGRMLGAFSPLAIERLTVHKAGYGAAHGSQLSGVLAASHDLVRQKHHLTVQADPLSLNARLAAQLSTPRGVESTVMLAGRTSVWDSYRYPAFNTLLRDWNTVDPVLTSTLLGVPSENLRFTPHRHGSDVGFSDLHAALNVRFNTFHKLYVSAYRGSNDVDTQLLTSNADPVTGSPSLLMLARDRYHWTNVIGQVRHEWLAGARALGTIRLRRSRHTLRHGYEMIDSQTAALPDGLTVPEIEQALVNTLNESPIEDGNRITEVALETTLDYSLTSRHHLYAGLEAVQVSNRFRVDSLFFQQLDFRFAGWRMAGFVEDRIALGQHTTVDAGLRLSYVLDRQTVYAEPRLALRYDAPPGPLGALALRLAGGLYRQFVNQFDLSSVGPSAAVPSVRFWLPVDRTLAPPRAYHFAADLLITPAPAWMITLESYYKKQPYLLAIDYTSLIHNTGRPHQANQADFIKPSRGYAYGGGLQIQRQDNHARLTLTYSYSQSHRRFPSRFDDRPEPTPWNEPHRLSLASDLFMTQGLTLRLRTRSVWGRQWGFRQAYYDFLAAHSPPGSFAPFQLDRPSDDTLPALYQVDIGLTYDRTLAGVTIQLRVDLLNVLNRTNVIDWSLASSSAGFTKIDRTLPGLTPSFSLRLQLRCN